MTLNIEVKEHDEFAFNSFTLTIPVYQIAIRDKWISLDVYDQNNFIFFTIISIVNKND